jgi:hypothetical protein
MSAKKILFCFLLFGILPALWFSRDKVLSLVVSSVPTCQAQDNLPRAIGICADGEQNAGIYNQNIGFFIQKESILLNRYTANGWQNLGSSSPDRSFWSAEILPAEARSLNLITIKPENCRSFSYQPQLQGNTAVLNLNYQNCQAGNYQINVNLRATITQEETEVNWQAQAEMFQGEGSIFSLTYPQLLIQPSGLGGNSQNTAVVIPFKEGKLAKWNRANFVSPYPSSRTSFQFTAAYNQDTGDGFYLTTEDTQGNTKVFLSQSPRGRDLDKPRLFSIVHYPLGCANSGQKSFNFPYPTKLKLFNGNWLTASKIYRNWFLNADKNLQPLGENSGIPNFVKDAALVNHIPVGYRNQSDQRIIEEFALWKQLLEETKIDNSMITTWYGWQKYPTLRPNQAPHAAVQSGQKNIESRPFLANLLQQLARENIYLLAYTAPHLADPRNYQTPDGFFDFSPWANKDLAGVYRTREPGRSKEDNNSEYILMDLGNSIWQEQANYMVSLANKEGFSGVYSDTLGMPLTVDKQNFSNPPQTCGNSQTIPIQTVAKGIHTLLGENKILMGESVADIFINYIPFRIVGDGLYEDFIPVTRAAFGEYIVSVLRLRDEEKYSVQENLFVEDFKRNLATMYVNGYILGKFDLKDIKLIQENPEISLYVKRLIKFSVAIKDYLRYGEYIDRLEVNYPQIENSVTRNYQNDTVAYSFVNTDVRDVRALTLEVKKNTHFPKSRKVCLFELSLDSNTWNIQEKNIGLCGQVGEPIKYNFDLAAGNIRVFIAR